MKPQQWTFETKVGDYVRVCHSARRSFTRNAPPLVPARVTGPILVTGICANAVRLGEGCWVKSWIRCVPPAGSGYRVNTKGEPRTMDNGPTTGWVLTGTGFK